jgi:DNA ligase D-like protein (predicted 3'-phosphoesterase)
VRAWVEDRGADLTKRLLIMAATLWQARGVGEARFVLHEHRKPRHHFDLRLEQDGVLRSWALPRGLPVSPQQNRLAVPVADHALEHLTYEDADKDIADTGTWVLEAVDERRFVFVLRGRQAQRRYALIRTDRDWLLHLTKDQPLSP